MKINVAQLLKENVGSVRQVMLSETDESGLPVRGQLQLLRTNRSILVSGKLDAIAGEVCSRCLEEFQSQLPLQFEEEFFLTRDPVTGALLSSPNEAGAFTVDENNLLDIGEAVRQYELLAEPMKPVCREDCAGLCSQCGCNLNHSRCGCTPIRPESPWEPLQNLLSDLKQPAE
jgi:uncharacterized protein